MCSNFLQVIWCKPSHVLGRLHVFASIAIPASYLFAVPDPSRSMQSLQVVPLFSVEHELQPLSNYPCSLVPNGSSRQHQ